MAKLLISVSAISLFILCALWALYPQNRPIVHAEGETISFDKHQKWERLCVSSQYEEPDVTISGVVDLNRCWGTREVPRATIFLTYVYGDASCKREVANGNLLQDGNSETRCFSYEEIFDL